VGKIWLKMNGEQSLEKESLQKVGFFHFGKRDSGADQIESLMEALQEASERQHLDDSLIVLPEAFNIRNGYCSRNRQLDNSITTKVLQEKSAQFNATFVVGLIEDVGFSSAYLIDDRTCEPLTRKMSNDAWDDRPNYKCSDNCDRAIVYRGICIAALICMDAAGFESPQHKALLAQMDSFGVDRKVLCVPAHFTNNGTREVATSWPSHICVVIGNSSPSITHPSVIRPQTGLLSCFGGPQDTVCVKALWEPLQTVPGGIGSCLPDQARKP
jgi:hypothetical protein